MDGELAPQALVHVDQSAVAWSPTGLLTDAEARRLTTTSFTLTREVSAAIDVIVGHPDTAYFHRGDFIRHACIELLNAWEQSGMPGGPLKDLIEHLRALRMSAYQLKLRQEFSEIFSVFEVSLGAGAEAGDWELVTDTLDTLQGYIERTPGRYWQEHLRQTIAKSPTTRAAVNGLYEASRRGKLRKEAEHWQRWLESLQG